MKLKRTDLEITGACNLHCMPCFANSGKRNNNKLDTKHFLKLINQLSNAGTEIVYLSGGEPLLNKDFFKIAKKISDSGMLVGIMSNLTLLNEEHIKKIKKLKNLAVIQTSLDGSTPEIHDRIRGVKGSFLKSNLAINQLIKEKLPVIIITTAMKQNISDVKNITALCSMKGIKCYVNLINVSGRADKSLYPSKNSYLKMIKSTFGLETVNFNNPKTIGNACGVGFNRIAVLPNGDIAPCMPMRNVVLGNIKTDDVIDVFRNHLVMKQIRKATTKNIKECRKCPAKNRCLGGCKQRAFAMHNRFDAPDDVQCVVFKKNHKPKLEHPENFPLV